MDNLAHTLAGLALAEAGLKRKTALATATLVIGANLPDVDALWYVFGSGTEALAMRRGWTHGVLAMLVLPLLLAGMMLLWDRGVRRRGGAREPVRPGWLLVLAFVGVWSHPLLDLLNTYGIRLLMPLSGRWFYGDTLFIVDLWLWLVLGAGVVLSWRRERRTGGRTTAGRPARVATAVLAVYVLAMAASSWAGRAVVERLAATGPAVRTMVGPVPVTPLRRQVVRDLGDRYEVGELRWGWPPRYRAGAVVPVGRDAPGVAAAARTKEGAEFLTWSRFPRFATRPTGDSILVRMSDMRYTDGRGRGWAAVEVRVPRE